MYLKYIRHKCLWGQLQRGTLYAVHFQPNEKGGYNEHRIIISDVYEVASGERLPLALIYPARVVCMDSRMRLTFGGEHRRSMLHLIDQHVRDTFFPDVRYALNLHQEVRIEIAES